MLNLELFFQNLFYAAGVYGLFIGIIAKSRYTTFRAPPSFVIPLSIAFCAKNLDASYGKQARLSLLVMSIAPAMAVYVVYGFISNSMEFAYIMWMVVMALATVADLHVIDFMRPLYEIKDCSKAADFIE